MKRALFLIATVTLVFTLSSCADIIKGILFGIPFKFGNRSSYAVKVFVDVGGTFSDETFTLKPGEDTEVNVPYSVDHPEYTYTPSDLVETGCVWREPSGVIIGYHFWDKGSPEPGERW